MNDVCLSCMKEHEGQRTWPNACVALMLAAHSVELFLKGAILGKKEGNAWGHTLAENEAAYRADYADLKFHFEVPFRTEYLGMTETEIEALKKHAPQPSILFRYPVRKPGTEWEGLHAFEPCEFLGILDALNKDYTRLIGEFGDI